ncbi:MAG: phosphoribosylaminoimidazolesuccinocarboxamide synthase [Pirellulaceae bacterium]
MSKPVLETNISGLIPKRGKVRDVYDLEDSLLMISSDRISAFDWVLPSAIPDKGRVLTKISEFWFGKLDIPNHLLTMDLGSMDLPEDTDLEALEGRSMVVKKCDVVPIECVVRGYLAGSGWKEYQAEGTVCGITLPEGLQQASQLETPIFTPATKEESGHDVNIPFARMEEIVGADVAAELRDRSVEIYKRGAEYARTKGVIIADTKFEWGWYQDELILIDEVMTPDSSRFWPAETYQVGESPKSYDKQFVRDWLETTDWDKNSPAPQLPEDIITKTRAKYIEAYEVLTEQPFAWK